MLKPYKRPQLRGDIPELFRILGKAKMELGVSAGLDTPASKARPRVWTL